MEIIEFKIACSFMVSIILSLGLAESKLRLTVHDAYSISTQVQQSVAGHEVKVGKMVMFILGCSFAGSSSGSTFPPEVYVKVQV